MKPTHPDVIKQFEQQSLKFKFRAGARLEPARSVLLKKVMLPQAYGSSKHNIERSFYAIDELTDWRCCRCY